MQTDVEAASEGYRVGLNQSLEGDMGEGEWLGIYLRCPAWRAHGSVERPEGYGARSRGSLPFLCSATVTGIVSDDEKTETRTGPPGRRRSQSATPIPGRRCADGQTARQPDSQTAGPRDN
jgi:hypothetical protein